MNELLVTTEEAKYVSVKKDTVSIDDSFFDAVPKNEKFKPNAKKFKTNANMKSVLVHALNHQKKIRVICNSLYNNNISSSLIANVKFELMENNQLNNRTLNEFKNDLSDLMLKWGLDMITIRRFGEDSYMVNTGEGIIDL